MPELESASVVLAHRDADARQSLAEMLAELGHHVLASVGSRAATVRAAGEENPDLFIASFDLEDGNSIDALVEASRIEPIPSIILAAQSQLAQVEKALEDHVMAYLLEPVTAADLRPTIHLVRRRFAEFQELRSEVESLAVALDARKVVERAKGYLMRDHGLSEEDAHRRLQKLANEKRKKLRDVAEAILLAAEL